MSDCPSTYLVVETEAIYYCARPSGHEGDHFNRDLFGALRPPVDIVGWAERNGIDISDLYEWPDHCAIQPVQVRGAHAPARRTDTWSPAALQSLQAGLDVAPGQGVSIQQQLGRERREVEGRLFDQLLADARAAGIAEERAAATERVFAWAATLSKVEDRLIAAKAAEVVEAGR